MKITKSQNTLDIVEKENTNSSEYLIETENIENTPFTIVKQENLYFGVIGNHRLTEPYNDKEELKKELIDINWNRLTQVIWAIVDKYKHNPELFKEN